MNNCMFDKIVRLDIIKGTVYFIFHTNSLRFIAQGLELKNKKNENTLLETLIFVL